MVETEQDRPLKEGFSGALFEVILGSIKGDLELRKKTLALVNPIKSISPIHFGKSFSGQLRFTALLLKQKKILFFIKKKKRENKVADIRVSFGFEAIPEAQKKSLIAPKFFVHFPSFISPSPDRKSFVVEISGQKKFKVFWEKRKLRFIDLESGKKEKFKKFSKSELPKLIEQLETFVKKGSKNEPLLLKPQRKAELGIAGLLSAVNLGFKTAENAIRLQPFPKNNIIWTPAQKKEILKVAKLDKQLREINPYLGGPFQFKSLRTNILVKFDLSGNLVAKGTKKEAQQYDLRISFLEKGSQGVDLTPKLADFLVSGPIFKTFSQFFGNLPESKIKDFKKNIFGKISGLQADLNATKAFFSEAAKNGDLIFLRLKERKSNDLEAVLARGHYFGQKISILFTANFKVSHHPNVEIKDIVTGTKDLKIIFLKRNQGSWKFLRKGNTNISEVRKIRFFFEKYFRTLLMFQNLMVEDPVEPPKEAD